MRPAPRIAPGTAHLPVPCQEVIDHARLRPFPAGVSAANRRGDPDHDPREPIFWWYQDTPAGEELYVAFYTLGCRWERCTFCTLPSRSSAAQVPGDRVIEQFSNVLRRLSPDQRRRARRLFLSNNGSVLDAATLPLSTLARVLRAARRALPSLEIVCLETRIETARPRLLASLQRLLLDGPGRPSRLQISAGYETQDPYLRNRILVKGYPEPMVQRFYAEFASASREVGVPMLLDENVMLRPAVGMTDEEGRREAVETILHVERLGRHHGIPVSMRLHPTFAAAGSPLGLALRADGYRPPTLRDCVDVLARARAAGSTSPIFVGLDDEGLAEPDGRFGNRDGTDAAYRRALAEHNRHQDLATLTRQLSSVDPISLAS